MRDLLDNPFVFGIVVAFVLLGVIGAILGGAWVTVAIAALFGTVPAVLFATVLTGLGLGVIIWLVEL